MFIEQLNKEKISKLLKLLKETKILNFKDFEYFSSALSTKGNYYLYIKLDDKSLYLKDEHIYVIDNPTYDHYKDVLTDEEKNAYYKGMFKDREVHTPVDIAYASFMYSVFGQKYFDAMDELTNMYFGNWVSNKKLHEAAKKFYDENIIANVQDEKER